MATTTHTPLPRPRSGRVAVGTSDRSQLSAGWEGPAETGSDQFDWWALTVLGPALLVAAGSLWAPSMVLALMALVAWGMLDAEEAWT